MAKVEPRNKSEKGAERKSMTISLSVREMKILEDLAEDQDLSKLMILRMALRLYNRAHQEVKKGKRVYSGNGDSEVDLSLLLLD